MTNQEFEDVYWPRYDSVVKAIARKLAQTNDSLVEDLYQEGLIALWECDPRKAKTNPDAFMRQAIKFRMIDFLRRERLKSTESLDSYLEYGMQLTGGANEPAKLLDVVEHYQRRLVSVEGTQEEYQDEEPYRE